MPRRVTPAASRAAFWRPGLWLAAALGTAGMVATALPADPASASVSVVVRVSTGGSDDIGDGSSAHPYRTIARAITESAEGAKIVVAGGTYDPFVMSKAGQSVVPAARNRQPVIIQGDASVQDVVRIAASGTTLAGVTVTGCVPSLTTQVEDEGSSDVRINDGTTGVTVRNLTITASEGTNGEGKPIGCFGILAHQANGFRIVANDISGTGTGVFVNGGARQAIVARNQIHDNRVLIRDTDRADDDFGANGVFLAHVNAVPGVLVTHNTLVNNQGPSHDYETDGGGVEIYDASNTRVIANTISNNDVALETGTQPGGSCSGNLFSGNQITGRTGAAVPVTRSPGLLLRCATAMVVSNNTFANMDWWVYDIEDHGQFSTDVNGLAITGNTVSQSQAGTVATDGTAGAPVYWLGVDPGKANLIINGNRFPTTAAPFATYVPYYGKYSDSPTLADWQSHTGQDSGSATK